MIGARKALAYIRVSVVGDRAARGRFESPDLQREAIDRWCEQHGITVVGEHRDLNRSGGIITRPGLDAAVSSLHAGEADGIIVAYSDRASRRVIDGLGLIETLKEQGYWIAAADGTMDTSTDAAWQATAMSFVMHEAGLRRYKAQSAVIHRRAIVEKGRHMGPAGFGYLRDDDTRLQLDPDRWEWARHVFEWRAERRAFTWMARELDAHGIRTRDGRVVNEGLLRRMVGRRVYVGEAVHGQHVHSDAHPAIVDEALWKAANRAVPRVGADPQVERVHEESLLRGLLRCAGCRYVLKRLPSRREGIARWKCRTICADRQATHECAAPVHLVTADVAVVEDLVRAEFFKLAGGQAVERAEAGDEDQLRRENADAQALLDELSSLETRRKLGAKRWRALVDEAHEQVTETERALAEFQSRRATVGVADRETLRQAAAHWTREEWQTALRSIVQAVMIVAGDRPVADRAFVVPVWESVELPRRGIKAFVARPWLPGQD